MSSRTSAIRCRCSSDRTLTDYNEKGTVNSDDKGETQNDVFDIPSKKARRIKKWRVLLVTGDHIYTARTIALECGILKLDQTTEESDVIEGKVFRNYTEDHRTAIVDKICVMGRSSPIDKLLLVQALKKSGEVVAVTGDGTDDAPALREADIGLSKGIQGTEVAKESSDIIILDDNFASVVKAVLWGRSVYASIQKIIQFQLTVIVAVVAINFVAAVSSGNVPLNAVQGATHHKYNVEESYGSSIVPNYCPPHTYFQGQEYFKAKRWKQSRPCRHNYKHNNF